MAPKKSRQPAPKAPRPDSASGSNGTATAQAPEPASNAIKAAPPVATPAQAATSVAAKAPARAPMTPPPRKAQLTPVEQALARASKILGSLQLAVSLLSFFAIVVLLGTWMEHAYGTKIAQELVYKAWWFLLLLFLLSVNIFFAAAKKVQRAETAWQAPQPPPGGIVHAWKVVTSYISHHWPWKRHQFGFIVTHIGLLTMLAGGVVTWAAGVDCVVEMLDTPNPEILAEFKSGIERRNRTHEYIFADSSVIRVSMSQDDSAGMQDHFGQPIDPHSKPKTKSTAMQRDIWPGALPWKTNPELKTDWVLGLMNWLHNPFGQGWSMDAPGGATVEVIDYLPLAQREMYSRSSQGGAMAFKLVLETPRFPQPVTTWLSDQREDRQFQRGPILCEMLGNCPTPLMDSFLQPPTTEALGKSGVLVAYLKGVTVPLSLDESLKDGRAVPVGNTGWTIKPLKYCPNVLEPNKLDAPATLPGVEVEVTSPKQTTAVYTIMPRLLDRLLKKDPDKKQGFDFAYAGEEGMPLFWFHAPDLRAGQEGMKGLLQFVQNDGKLFYRSYAWQDNKGFICEAAAPVQVKQSYNIWPRMKWSFRVTEQLATAVRQPRYSPVTIPPGKESQMDKQRFPNAVQCRLTVPGDRKPREFWLALDHGAATMNVGGKNYEVEFMSKRGNMGFELRLERAEQTVDPGGRSAATYTSFVQLFDPEYKIDGEHHVITMNEPLLHRGLKFYQSQYNFLDIWDDNGKPVSLSGFTVGYDPGLAMKYAGSIMLALGIAIMFYMRAYFFKSSGKQAAAG